MTMRQLMDDDANHPYSPPTSVSIGVCCMYSEPW